MSAELDEVRARLAAATAAEQAARAEAEKLRGQLAAVSERAASAEARAGESARRADDLNAELARLHTQNAALVQSLSEAARSKGRSAGGAAAA